ncbi:hypothetical protein, partial [Photobacterium sanguinicancri]
MNPDIARGVPTEFEIQLFMVVLTKFQIQRSLLLKLSPEDIVINDEIDTINIGHLIKGRSDDRGVGVQFTKASNKKEYFLTKQLKLKLDKYYKDNGFELS